MTKAWVGAAVFALAGLVSACGSDASSSGGDPTATGEAGSVHLALNGDLNGNLAIIAIQNVFDRDENWLIECMRKDHELNGQQFCDELVVLPPGVYEIVVQSPDPDCEAEQDHYKVIVEPNETTEIMVSLVCGQDNGAIDTIVTEDHRPLIEDIRFRFPNGEQANKFVCDNQENVTIELVLSDEDTPCADLSVTWTPSSSNLVLGNFVAPHLVNGECIASADVLPFPSFPGDYTVTAVVADDGPNDPHTTSLTFPIHVIPCPPAD